MRVNALNFVLERVVCMKVMIGIPAYEEENNIGKLLNFLLQNCSNNFHCIYVISSGSKDRTDEIVSSYSHKYPKIKLITEGERKGKVSALNKLLTILEEKYEVLIYMGADNIPEKRAISKLLNYLRNDDTAAVGGRPVPINSKNNLMGFFAHLLWNLHHLISLEHPKISGELMAFKKGVLRELPIEIINDDLYIQSIFEFDNYNVKYCSDAIVYLKGSETINDFIKQRRRIFIGHKQIESALGKRAPTMRLPKWSLILKACPFTGLKGCLYAVLFVFFQGLAFLLSLWDFHRGKLPYKWDMVKTSKTLESL